MIRRSIDRFRSTTRPRSRRVQRDLHRHESLSCRREEGGASVVHWLISSAHCHLLWFLPCLAIRNKSLSEKRRSKDNNNSFQRQSTAYLTYNLVQLVQVLLRRHFLLLPLLSSAYTSNQVDLIFAVCSSSPASSELSIVRSQITSSFFFFFFFRSSVVRTSSLFYSFFRLMSRSFKRERETSRDLIVFQSHPFALPIRGHSSSVSLRIQEVRRSNSHHQNGSTRNKMAARKTSKKKMSRSLFLPLLLVFIGKNREREREKNLCPATEGVNCS